MNKYLIAVVMVVLVAARYSQRGEAQPTHICSANASSYRDLVDLGFCDIGDKTFSNFNSFFNTAAGAPPPSWQRTSPSRHSVAPRFGASKLGALRWTPIPISKI